MTAIFCISHLPISLTLTPLRIGTIVANALCDEIKLDNDKIKIKLKWPNDVLFGDDGKKVAGVLIRIQNNFMLVVRLTYHVTELHNT